jgi:hypothetical protein
VSGSRGREEPCPYLGQHWDPSVRAYGPDPENRCFARFRRVSFLWFFRRRRIGAQTELAYQGSVCYGDYRRCRDYQRSVSLREPPKVSS